jgi:hypothetical protein
MATMDLPTLAAAEAVLQMGRTLLLTRQAETAEAEL